MSLLPLSSHHFEPTNQLEVRGGEDPGVVRDEAGWGGSVRNRGVCRGKVAREGNQEDGSVRVKKASVNKKIKRPGAKCVSLWRPTTRSNHHRPPSRTELFPQ